MLSQAYDIRCGGLNVVDPIPGYAYGSQSIPPAPISLTELDPLKISVGWTADDHRLLKQAGGVLAPQAKQIVAHWRAGIIASIPHLARHSRTPDNQPLPDYLARSSRRFEQWILDTCLRDYDQDWLNYQFEIARRHTTLSKNKADGVGSTPFVPYRDIVAFTAVMNETIKPYLAAAGHPAVEVGQMHAAWCRSLQLQIALWGRIYADPRLSVSQW